MSPERFAAAAALYDNRLLLLTAASPVTCAPMPPRPAASPCPAQ